LAIRRRSFERGYVIRESLILNKWNFLPRHALASRMRLCGSARVRQLLGNR
jgi:hypothetical protein